MLGLTALAAAATNGVSAWAAPRDTLSSRLEILLNVGALVALLAAVAFVVVALVHRAAVAGGAEAPPLRTMLLRALPGTTAAIVVLSRLAIEHRGLVQGADGEPSFRVVELLGSPSTGSGITVVRRPWGIAVTPDGRKLCTANGLSHEVSVIDVATQRVVAAIPAEQRAWGC